MSTIHQDINANRLRPLSRFIVQGTNALKKWNPKDNRTHPAVRETIKARGDRAGFFIEDGILFQFTVGLSGDTRGIGCYYPVRGCHLYETARLAKIFEVDEREVPNIIFANRA